MIKVVLPKQTVMIKELKIITFDPSYQKSNGQAYVHFIKYRTTIRVLYVYMTLTYRILQLPAYCDIKNMVILSLKVDCWLALCCFTSRLKICQLNGNVTTTAPPRWLVIERSPSMREIGVRYPKLYKHVVTATLSNARQKVKCPRR